ncbi:MAG: hypothetical protein N3I35_09325 [Clostridia bacterium]|nr:hypothetical protein [Clostridia bacterium]
MNKDRLKSFFSRRSKACVGIFGITQLHLRNPFVVAWWSAAFPGLGHIILSKYLRGYILFLWEIVINLQSNINLGFFYSFTGRFDMAKAVINKSWVLLYIPTYLFAVWDSYRTTVDINHHYILASREDAEIKTNSISTVEFNYLDKRIPCVSLVWSGLMPGIGQLYLHRLPAAFFILFWWIVIIYFSKALPAIHYTLTGNPSQAAVVLDPQWFLNLPSIYFFSAYDAYTKTVENNKLFEWEQSKFLQRSYQNGLFHMPSKKKENIGESMHIVSTFEHSIYLEIAITAIQMKGIDKKDILAIPMDKKGGSVQLFDSIHSSDGLSLLDLPMIIATLFTLFGGIYGFILKWGPIIWGLIGMIIGLFLGLTIKILINRKYSDQRNNKKSAEVVLIIECTENQAETVKNTLWEHHALGVRKLILGKDMQ